MHSIDSESAEKQKYIKLDTTRPMVCPVCNQQIIPKNAHIIMSSDILDSDSDKKKVISSAPKRYYECSCYENQSKIYFQYSEGLIETVKENEQDKIPIVELGVGKNIASETPLSDTMPHDTYENKTYYQYDNFQTQNNNNTDIDLHLIKASDILVDDYIRGYSGIPDEAKENAILEYLRVIKLCNTLSLLAIMCGRRELPFGFRYAGVCDPFNTSIPDLLIYSGSPFWEFVKELLLQSALTFSKWLLHRHGNLNKGGKYNPLKKIRDDIIDHPKPDFNDQESKSYIDLLYEFARDIEQKINKRVLDKYNLKIEDYWLLLGQPEDQTIYDRSFVRILGMINHVYEQFIVNQPADLPDEPQF